MKKYIILVTLIHSLILCSFTYSEENQPEEDFFESDKMVVTSTMSEKIIKDAPGAIEVITTRDLIEMNAQTLADALLDAAGLVVTTESGRIIRPGIRGTGNKHTLVLIDGRRIVSGFKDMSGIEQIPVEMVSRIEVVRGPASALYGSDAVGGVINIITKKPSDSLSAGGSFSFGQTTYSEGDEYNGSAYAGSSFDKFGFFIAGGYRDKDRFDLDNAAPDDSDEISMTSLGARFTYDINSSNSLITGFEAIDRDFAGLRDLQNMDRERAINDKRLSCYIEYDGKLAQTGTLMLRANRSEHENNLTITPPTNPIAGSIGDESHAERSLNQFEGRYTDMLNNSHLLTFGAEYVEETRTDASGMDNDVDTLSLYLQDEYQIIDPLYLVMSVRWDDYSDYGSEWTPRASLTYSIKSNFRFKASYGMGFRAPDFLELYVPTYMKQGKQIYEPNPSLEAESSKSFEAGVEGEYKDFQGRITWFDNSIEDMIDAVYYTSTGSGKSLKEYFQYRNISKASMHGLELEGSLKLPAHFTLTGNFSYLKTKDETTGKELEGKPDCKGSLKLGYNYNPMGIRLNLRATYLGDRYYESGESEHTTLFKAYFSKDISKTMSLFAGVDNIFNRDDYGNPRYFYTGIRFDLDQEK